MRTAIPCLLALGLLTFEPLAQPNTVAGKSSRLTVVNGLAQRGRVGSVPNGEVAVSMGTVICNTGSVQIQWIAPMNNNHPFYPFIVCMEANGRFEQISNRSFLKHGFTSVNSNGCGGGCGGGGPNALNPNCSDTYSSSLNADNFWLGPADEVDPWLGAWDPVGSFFDQGSPNVGPPQNMDGNRSFTQTQANNLGPLGNRVRILDQDLATENASFFYGAYAVIIGEAENLRDDNMISRPVNVSLNGNNWQFQSPAGQTVNGTILQHWSGASIDSAANGNDDGRFYVAVQVTGPDSRGLWHYEYAIHNRDNSRGAAAFRIPKCSSARILNPTFHDIDSNAANDWTVSETATEIAFLAGAGNALNWNTIYNFGFDSDAGPSSGQVTLDQALPGAGAATVTVNSQFPDVVLNQYLGDGCGSPTLSPTGSPPNGAIPNPTFGLALDGLQPNGTAFIFLSANSASIGIGSGCFLFAGAPAINAGSVNADINGTAIFPLPIPSIVELEGGDVTCQALEPAIGGAYKNQLNLTNGLKIRVGNARTNCP